MSMTLCDRLRQGLPPPFDVIDMHGHVGRYAYPIPDLSTARLTEVMDRIHVSRIVCSHMQCMSTDTVWGNSEVLRHMRESDGRILGYVAVFPSSPDTVRDQVTSWIAQGFTGLKFHDSNRFRYDDPAYEPAYRLAHDHAMPVLLHTWGDAAEFAAAIRAAKAYPDLTIILAHGGSQHPDDYIQTVQAAPNIVLDTCFSRCPLGLIEYLVKGAGEENVVFGSDAYFYSLTQQLGKVMGAELSDSVKQRILRENGERILSRIRGPA